MTPCAGWRPTCCRRPTTSRSSTLPAVLGELRRIGPHPGQAGFYDANGDGTITFHDACKIQRKGGHIQEPRDMLEVLAPKSFKEMTPQP